MLVFGRSLERLCGSTALLAVFPTLGAADFLMEWAVDAASPVPMIVASGAIVALM